MNNGIPKLKTPPCGVLAGKYNFLTPDEEKEGLVKRVAKDLQVWIQDGLDAIDFPFPKQLEIDCKTARQILTQAELVRTGNLH